jgi:hypothetical protein
MKRHLVAVFGFALAAVFGAACGSDAGPPAGEETGSQGEAMSLASISRIPPPQLVAANHFELSGGGLEVFYAPLDESGLPVLVYRDAQQSLTFRGSDVHTTSTEVGTLVTVYTRRTVDSGSTSFSVIIPSVQVASNAWAPVETQGITTVHHFSVVPSYGGQLDGYTFTPLGGTAKPW